ncbi:hypothetical protein NPIL_326571 [Nephila pilipes]|uniref:Uncharacterized protein n=1 Tax=Nephila pilipes TaxID=299642 RepID=A0A8X6NR03_NEPPI|nr:hypothetical protein NPIL_326571 [Nephila pilipes]
MLYYLNPLLVCYASLPEVIGESGGLQCAKEAKESFFPPPYFVYHVRRGKRRQKAHASLILQTPSNINALSICNESKSGLLKGLFRWKGERTQMQSALTADLF